MPFAGILELPKKPTICEAKLVPCAVKFVRVLLTPAVSLRLSVKDQLSPCELGCCSYTGSGVHKGRTLESGHPPFHSVTRLYASTETQTVTGSYPGPASYPKEPVV